MSAEPAPFRFGEAPVRTTVRLAGLDRLGDRLARRVRLAIEPIARTKTQVVAEPVVTQRFEAWTATLPPFMSLSLYRLRPLKGSMLLAIEADFVTRMVDAFYGGSGTGPAATQAREFTPAEERLLGRIADTLVERLAETWSEVTPLEPQLAARETNIDYAGLVRGDETVVVQTLTVTPGTMAPTRISIVYPFTALRPLEPLLAAKTHEESGPGDGEWRAQLTEAVMAVRLPVRSVLARPELSVAELMALKPGDVIPITLASTVPLTVAGRRLASGTIGEREGRAALMIEQIEGQG
ncbi:flagellar motor switch protein FliM [Sphingomonas jatrophae]|uniref:Flagellar motor switch protein FliM n=1 Tax=Sphingomonas jatrophae TaxID=1166337 RepID=A0A1I6MB99_9SPHN|nr:FliM/FliN family flagellar motor switch protein [Sphingomonas jatrophae]SFS12941.1 flagellar motor switch protein FliM [Sphingomonas jatrophae]